MKIVCLKTGRNIPLFLGVLLSCGCSTLPHFKDPIYGEHELRPTVVDMTNELQCEILGTLKKSKAFNAGSDTSMVDAAVAPLSQYFWAVTANLKLDVTDDEGANPSLSYIDPLKAANTNFTAALGAQFSAEQHRNINIQFTLFINPNAPTDHACDGSVNKHHGLHGNLGIEEIITTGLPYAVGLPQDPYITSAIGVSLTGAPSAYPTFGTTIDFTIIYGAGATPTWTLTHFAGPGPSSGSLLSAMRTHKDTLVLSFTKAQDETTEAMASAAKLSQDNVTRMILQRLLP